jgi:alpha-tubulin suppressor-like RCC1 family protein
VPATVLGGQRRRPGRLLQAALSCACLGVALLPTTAHAQSSAFTVGWGGNAFGSLGAGYTGRAWGPVASKISGVRALAASIASYALLENGTVDAWGENAFGELGNGTHDNSATPVPVPGLTGVVAVAAGDEHAMALLGNGTVMTWGGNTFGTMGNGTSGHGHEISDPNPTLVPGLHGVVAIAAGGADDVALLANGTLEAWGENKSGQLGDGTTVEKELPTPVDGLSDVKAVAIGGDASIGGHMLALLANGTVMAVGGNAAGQLGDGSTEALSTTPVQVAGLSGVTAISADISHSMALLEDGTAESWGSDTYGELGVLAVSGTCAGSPCSRLPVRVPLSHVTSISAGFRFSDAISSGKLYSWGWNLHRQLGGKVGLETATPTLLPGVTEASSVVAGAFHSLALVSEPGAAPTLEATPGPGSLTVNWSFSEPASEQWIVKWRPADQRAEWSQRVLLAPGARSYTITGLSSEPYEVRVGSKGRIGFGKKTVTGTPLG